jgi:hypothetical protein
VRTKNKRLALIDDSVFARPDRLFSLATLGGPILRG